MADEDEKYQKGFPQLAAFMSSDDDFNMILGNKYLHTRVLLQKMVEIEELDKALSALDKRDATDPRRQWRLTHCYEEGDDPEQRDLLKKIEVSLKEYGECESAPATGVKHKTEGRFRRLCLDLQNHASRWSTASSQPPFVLQLDLD